MQQLQQLATPFTPPPIPRLDPSIATAAQCLYENVTETSLLPALQEAYERNVALAHHKGQLTAVADTVNREVDKRRRQLCEIQNDLARSGASPLPVVVGGGSAAAPDSGGNPIRQQQEDNTLRRIKMCTDHLNKLKRDLEIAKQATHGLASERLQLCRIVAAAEAALEDHDVSNRLRAEAEARQAAIVAELYANFECTICCKSARYDQKAIFNCCQGVACRDCATHFLLEAMHRPAIQCMFCQSPDLIGQDAQLILSDDRYELFARCRQNAEVTAALNATAVRCRAINCRGIVEREDLGLPNTASTAPHHFVCTVDPGHQWCLQCDVPWHVDSSCEQYQECRQNNDRADELMMELLERMGWKRCPTCRQGVERLPRTCNVVNCPTCRGNMCYLCEAVLDANTAVAHMHYGVEGHPCYAKCFFGCGIDDDAEPAAAPDVA